MQSRRTFLNPAAILIGQLFLSGISAAQETQTSGTAPQASAAQPAAGGAAEEVATGAVTDGASKKKLSEDIVVTGSRIRRKDLTTPAPVTVISREQVVASGKSSIGEFLQALPEQGNAINTSVNNGGSGATRISLRGLGENRTLVLLNGRRMVPGGTGANDSVDLNSIPTAAIERVEILKDGASAIYGSDAIAGVVNIITRNNYSSTEASAYGGMSSRGDGKTYDVNVTTGSTGERGNITFSAGYAEQKPVLAGDRDFSKLPRAYDATGLNNPSTQIGEYNVGSGTVPAGRFTISAAAMGKPVSTATPLYNSLVTTYPKNRDFVRCDPSTDPTCTLGWRPFIPFLLPPNGDAYNFQPENYLVTPQKRISLYASGNTRLGDVARAFFEASYVNRQSGQKLAAEPLGTSGEGVVVSKDNLYNPFGVNLTNVRRRLLEFGNRSYSQDIDTYRIVGGLDGRLPNVFGPLEGWFWEVSGNYGRTSGDQVKQGNLRRSQLQNALGPSDPATGACLTAAKGTPGSTVIPNCVPLNLFGGPGTITPDQITNLTFTGTQRGVNQLAAVQANISGELFPLPFADRPVGLAAGYEYRNLQGAQIPDPITVAGDTTGNKGLITQGQYHVNEGYAELSVPIISNVPFAENVEATAAARVFRYSNFGSDYTYKFGGRWQVIRDLTIRGTYGTAFRAPSINDLYLGQRDTFSPVTDPCRNLAGVDPNSTLFKTCIAQGVPPGGSGDTSTQLRSRVGGNPNLQPEKAKIGTAGVVLQPSMLKGLSVTVDYYNIAIDNTISNLGESVILQGCYAGNTQYCNFIQRDANGNISSIYNLNANVGSERQDGIDLAVRYTLPTPVELGRIGLIFDGTWLHKYDRTLADGSVIRGRGTFDLNSGGTFGVYPAFKFNAGIAYGLGAFGAGVNTRFIGSFTECGDSNGDFSGSGLCYQDSTYRRRVSAYNTYDVFVSYTLASAAGKTAIAAGINNVFDKAPSVIYNGFLASSDPSAYDFMGRFPYVRLSHTY